MPRSPAQRARLEEQLAYQQELILAGVEQAGLIDLPQSRLRIEKVPEDRILVMEFLYAVNRQGVDPATWCRMNPEKAERLNEIMPRKPRDEG